jgi:hypothetical protein
VNKCHHLIIENVANFPSVFKELNRYPVPSQTRPSPSKFIIHAPGLCSLASQISLIIMSQEGAICWINHPLFPVKNERVKGCEIAGEELQVRNQILLHNLDSNLA